MLETAPDQVDLEKLVHSELRRLLVERDRPPGVIEASSRLGLDLGFESLDLALLVARLEVATGLGGLAKSTLTFGSLWSGLIWSRPTRSMRSTSPAFSAAARVASSVITVQVI